MSLETMGRGGTATEPGPGSTWARVPGLLMRALWPPGLVFGIYVVGLALGILKQLPGIDMVFHLVGGFAIACSVSMGLRLEPTGRARYLEGVPRVFFIVGMTSLAALLWEFAEFAVDNVFDTRFQTDLPDTMSDLALGLVGGILLVSLQRLLRSTSVRRM